MTNFILCTYSKLNSIKDGYSLKKILKNKTLLYVSCNICPTIYVNIHLSRLTYRRAPAKGSNPVLTRNRRICKYTGHYSHKQLSKNFLQIYISVSIITSKFQEILFSHLGGLDLTIHSSDMSIILKFLTNQIAFNEIIIVMTPYCPTPQHLLHMQKGLMTFGESKSPGYLNFLWKYSQTHYNDAQVSERWTIDERKYGGRV